MPTSSMQESYVHGRHPKLYQRIREFLIQRITIATLLLLTTVFSFMTMLLALLIYIKI